MIVIDTNKGQITLELFPEQAPASVTNFLAYIEKDEFKQSTFHRVIKGFMIQGGGFLASGERLETNAPIKNESRNGLSNERGTIAMARTGNPHSATRQFFINHKDNLFLDASGGNWGYAVFGKVTKGMDVVDKIANVQTGAQDKPVTPVIINRITVVTDQSIMLIDKK
ncbi:peptidylprolyl isomerase [Psychromonas algarum]|uniref:peptidylprolyl isomerase n=1 Tax=Psychromonas algarum TaxID=2555643 RepID=UPI001ABB3F19|nr:peptidylprolyl isomerase [Psychromonas sp. RZ22]